MPRLQPRRTYSQVSLKTAFTCCFAVLLTAAMMLFVLKTLLSITLVVAATIIAIALDHAVAMLERRRLGRGVAIGLTILMMVLALGGFFLLIIPPAVGQVRAFVTEAPKIWYSFQGSRAFSFLEANVHLTEKIQALGENATRYAQGAVAPLLAVVGGVVSAVAGAVTILFLVVFMLIFGGPLVRSAVGEVLPEHRERYQRVLGKIYSSVGGYLGGLLLICSVNASLTTAFLAIARVPFFLPLGILSGTSSLVPYAGPIVAGSAISLVALATGGTWKGVATAIYFILYGQLEGNVLGPLIFRRTVHINPLLTLLSILFLAELAGVVGAIIAVPAVAAAQIIVRELLAIRRERIQSSESVPTPNPVHGTSPAGPGYT